MKTAVRASALPTLLASAPNDIHILSLDCFDTLIWRNVNLPVDVFADLSFPGGGIEARSWGEKKARKSQPFINDRHEVTIEEIYEALMPEADQATRTAAIDAELAAEAAHCFAFAPTRDLIVDAKRRGMQVIIVSDTYLSEPQLRALITAAAGQPVADMIDRIFCSCEYGVSKSGGLFTHVLADLGVSPSTILHIGDNQMADAVAPAKLGVHTVHLEQFDAVAEQRLRLEAVAATILDPNVRSSVPALQPHRAQISLRETEDAVDTLGHDVLGPIMHSFALWIRDEADAMAKATGRRVKPLFLLRDGYLPAQAFSAACPDWADRVASVEISRFTATAASFTDAAAIERYLAPEIDTAQFATFAKQLLFTRDETAKLCRGATRRGFLKAVLEPANVRKIVKRSADFAKRLFAHLESHGVERGDAVMLVDLGYNGSVQNAVEAVLRAGMDLEVSGRYLLLRETFLSGLDKRGFMDTRHHDSKALHALSESIAILEQFCTLSQGSVVDYKANGWPVRSTVGVKGAQSANRDRAQQACIDFVRGVGTGIVKPPLSDDSECRRRMAGASLARLLFLPIESEVALLETFHHDVNLGTRDMVGFIDTAAATEGLRRRGLFYAKNAMRAYLPGELQRHGLPLNLSIFSSRRFGLDLRKADFDVGAMKLPVFLINQSGDAFVEIDAFPTSEGYFQAMIPIADGKYTVGIPLGQKFEWVQVEEASFHYVDDYMKPRPIEGAITAAPMFDAMEEVSTGLYHCPSEASFMLVPPPIAAAGRNLMLSVVLRPVVARTQDAPSIRKAA
ncbi:MAG: hydrolase [Sphingopyxis sp.]|uniref:HAD family hydrolase n=1 Tax=Sphingopyxis sp. TaxID=1908224 RepID=UPI002ABB775B|nr:HAD family hydrolase [Sphingopyxis sp.]MDZ3833734.1 hydrolase [Sphingopyxis sp.]